MSGLNCWKEVTPVNSALQPAVQSAGDGMGRLSAETDPAVSQANGNGNNGALGDVIVDALQELLKVLFSPIEAVIESHGDAVLQTVVGTPHPDAVFSQPTNAVWPGIYEYYWKVIVPLSLSLFGLAIGIIIFLESTSHLFSGYHRSKLKRRAFAGLLGILSWWWIAALSLRFMDALAGFLVPTVSEISLFQTLSFTGMGALGIVVTLSTNFLLFVLIGLVYLVRQLALYLFVFLMPLLIVFWIPGVGPFVLASKFMKKLAGFYVPFLFMTVPVALLFRLGEILGTSFGVSAGGFGAWLTALVIPFLAVVSPFVLFWQAGALFFIADRAAQHVSAERAQGRMTRGREQVQTATQEGRNFIRGMRDEPAVRAGGQYVLDSGGSRAHATGQRLNTAGAQLRDVITRNEGGGNDGSGGGGGGVATGGTVTREDSGAEDFRGFEREDTLREPPSRDRETESDDDSPRYIQ